MRIPLRTLAQIHACRRTTEGRLGAEQIAICGACDWKWSIDLDEALRILGEDATGRDLIEAARCPHCGEGLCQDTYVVIDTSPQTRPVWFGGLFEERLDGVESFATMKSRPRSRGGGD